MLHPNSFLASLVISLFSISVLIAQTGSIKGTVKDSKTNEPLIGAAVAIQGTTNGSITDSEGNFLISKAPVGKQVLTITYISYLTKKIEISVEAGKQIILNTALDEDAGQTLQEVVVTASKATNTEVAVISEIKSIQQVAVGVSAQQITKSQDRDAAQVARRIPGVSIVDNRFILIRGLSQRYNTVMINDIIAPSTEIDSRAFSFDMIPSNIIDRILIYKSGAAELPGEFAGGIIKIYTKRAPEENFTNVGLSLGYRANTTFQQVQRTNYGKWDFLGFEGKDRQVPSSIPSNPTLFNSLSPEARALYANKLPNTWDVQSKNVPLDIRGSLNFGRRFDAGSVQIGNLTSINYTSTNQYSENQFGIYRNGTTAGSRSVNYTDDQFVYNSRLGLLHNWSFRFNPKFTLEFKNLFNQLGFSETVVRNGQDVDDNREIKSYSERFESRSIYSGQLIGKHNFTPRWMLNWQLGYSYTRRTEPDWRRLKYTRNIPEPGETPQEFSAQTDGLLVNSARFNSKLTESVYSININNEYTLGSKVEEGSDSPKLRFGLYAEKKMRDFSSRWFGYTGGDQAVRKQDIGTIFNPANVTGASNAYFTIVEGTQPNDKYTASNDLVAGYVGTTLPVTTKFNLTAGVRVEANNQYMKSKPSPTTGSTTDLKVDKNVVVALPSLNLTYDLNDKQLVRLAYFSSINRPELRELAPFQYYDFNNNANVQGNESLKTVRIQNVDARWEYYPTPSELVSFGAFYKHFKNPIETFLPEPNTPLILDYTFINAKSAYSYGLEAEVRKSFSELSSNSFLQKLTVVANASYIISRIDLGDYVQLPSAITTEPYDVRGITDTKRPMMNQSPYLINAGLYYNNEATGIQANILYNVYGPRIYAVGSSLTRTIYEMPRNVIDLTFIKTFAQKWEIKAGIQDILNQKFRLEQDYNRDAKITAADKQPVRTFRRGSYLTLGVTYNF
ncbi:TonB-dependent receptor [Xanthocytophaga flava]|uniref:TonB-dependent receptor n=1 Tax=Xanthocytophaga flava TaxID=3048013 RepID=UPI0028D82BAB|nr:TonB-dependent receptor [Xanthocytophaga flavus]MDJ1472150.1 TonB-dependent receptor [Xanthocytophaga flavus]